MPIYRMFNSSGLEADRIPALAAVFEDICRALGLSTRDDGLRDIVAEVVIRCAEGVTDLDEIRECAEAALRKNSSQF
jgi:hypothetical protein